MSYSADIGSVVHLARSGSVDDACKRYGISRPKLYKMISEHPEVAKRFGGMTLIDFAAIDAVIDQLPTTREAPTTRGKQLVNLPGGRVSKVVAAARARKAAEPKNSPA
jgi:excisionase family DNA binding protein